MHKKIFATRSFLIITTNKKKKIIKMTLQVNIGGCYCIGGGKHILVVNMR